MVKGAKMTKEINLEDISLDVLQAALKIIQTKEGKTEYLGEALVHETMTCLLCDAVEEKEFTAKEVLQINSVGDVKWIQLVDDKDEPIFNGTYRYKTYRTNCPRCIPRLCRLPKTELAEIAITLAKATLWAARRAGKPYLDHGEEVEKE